MSSFAKRLKDAVDASSLSCNEIDERLEVESGSTNRWIRGEGEPDTPTVNRLSEILGVSANYLLFGAKTMGEMKAMFPNDANPSPTPISDWRFLLGAVLLFVGAVGILMMVMRYSVTGLPVPKLLAELGAPVYIFGGIAVLGIVICVVTSVAALSTKKTKKKDRNKK